MGRTNFDAPISVGQKVQWTSQSAGSTKTKTGYVVFNFNSARADYSNTGLLHSPILIAKEKFPLHKYMFDGNSWPNKEGILVEVCGGKTDRAKPKLYMPQPSQVEIIR